MPSDLATGFAPISQADATILILGSLPGTTSLRQQQYYAHPQNAFWRILQSVFAIAADAPYAERYRQVRAHRIALWDVCHSAQRSGSLDSAIAGSSVIANDIPALLRACPQIRLIAFNGQAAAKLFKRHIILEQPLPTLLLPSSSPAHASMRFEQKVACWQQLAVERKNLS